ncbi:MAG: DUF2207 domain-containing protein, partial [Clostridiaceae bacterium]|nr:DUF2207 domain-containing protein [Clostridiaceae bacterium]
MVRQRRKLAERTLWILFIAILLLAVFSPAEVYAQNKIESIQIDAYIQENGSVLIRDHRIFDADKGTEHYISLGNLGDSELLSFYVYDENGELLEYAGAWNVDASFAEKAGKYGINKTAGGMEICFGLGAYGRREFTIEYEISNFIRNLTDDHQAFYWQFINRDMDPIANIEIEVKNDLGYEFVYPESRIWGLGHEGGRTEITNNALTFNSSDRFLQSDYVVLLGIFEGAPFATDYRSDMSSEELIEKALAGTSGAREDNRSKAGSVFSSFMMALVFLVPIAAVIASSAKVTKKQPFKPTAADSYYREVPYQYHFINTQYFTNSEVSDWISAFILKWVSEGRLQEQTEVAGRIFKKEKLALRILPQPGQHSHELEARLWTMLVAAAGEDQILSEKEFNRYVKRNIKVFNSWTEDVVSQSEQQMTSGGYLVEYSEKVFKILTRKRLEITPQGQDLGNKIFAFKNYLKDFSLLEERGVSHVGLWQELMVWAAFMGIAEQVYEQLKIVNPQLESYM